MPFIKKLLKWFFTLLILVLLGASCFIMYDYYKFPEKYDSFAEKFSQRVTGKDKITIEDVSPFVDPQMTLSLDGTPYQDSSFLFCKESDYRSPVIMCYGKDVGGPVFVPCERDILMSASLYEGVGVSEKDISEFVSQNLEFSRIEISEEFLKELDAGEYYIAAQMRNDAGEQYFKLVPMIIEDQITFNSFDRGFVTYGDEFSWIVNDLENPKDISLPFYNLGDNPIRALVYASANAGSYQTVDVNPEDYTINERGDTVTLKKEFLQRQLVNTSKQFLVRLANGDVLDMGWTVIGTVSGDSLRRLTITGPDTYSISKGGDFTAEYDLGLCDEIFSFALDFYGEDGSHQEIINEILRGEDTSKFLNMSTHTITIPAEFMSQLTTDPGNHILQIAYFVKDVWLDAFLFLRVTE